MSHHSFSVTFSFPWPSPFFFLVETLGIYLSDLFKKPDFERQKGFSDTPLIWIYQFSTTSKSSLYYLEIRSWKSTYVDFHARTVHECTSICLPRPTHSHNSFLWFFGLSKKIKTQETRQVKSAMGTFLPRSSLLLLVYETRRSITFNF